MISRLFESAALILGVLIAFAGIAWITYLAYLVWEEPRGGKDD